MLRAMSYIAKLLLPGIPGKEKAGDKSERQSLGQEVG
jgi:hypothetical protein